MAAGQAANTRPFPRRANLARGIAWSSVIAAFLTCAGILVYGSGRGLDLTDEIFYLVWAADPKAYGLVYQPFGYLLHPLYRLVGGDLQAYRLAGMGIAAGAGPSRGIPLDVRRAEARCSPCTAPPVR